MPIDVRVLGPVELHSGGESMMIGPAKRQAIFVALALEANQSVPLPRLAEMVWAGPPPRSAVANLRTHIAALRRVLGERISSPAGAYQLQLDPGEFDVELFRHGATRGRKALVADQPRQAVRHLTAAFDLWRGPAGGALPRGAALDVLLNSLNEERLHVFEDLIDARLAEGEHVELTGSLRRHLARHPLRERAWGQLMVAFYRGGDTAAALNVYRQARANLTEQLGVEPGGELARLHRAVLDRAPALESPRSEITIRQSVISQTVVPCELPADLATFVGRSGEVAEVVATVREATSAAVLVTGAGGAGKSVLAVRAAHLLAADFPDGQIAIGLGNRPGVPSGQVLARALRALGVFDQELPAAEDELAGRYRSLVAGRRVLVLVDGATDAAQLRALVPAGPGPALIAVSRRRLAGLDGIHRIAVGPMPEAQAYKLLAACAGVDRLEADPTAAADLVRLCAGSPLVLRIVGALLTGSPQQGLRTLVKRLSDPYHRLDLLVCGDVSVRDCLATGYELAVARDELAVRVFGLLGEMSEATAEQTAVRLGVPVPRARRALEELVEVHLAATDQAGRYRLPALACEYAQQLASHPVGILSRRRRSNIRPRSVSLPRRLNGRISGWAQERTCR